MSHHLIVVTRTRQQGSLRRAASQNAGWSPKHIYHLTLALAVCPLQIHQSFLHITRVTALNFTSASILLQFANITTLSHKHLSMLFLGINGMHQAVPMCIRIFHFSVSSQSTCNVNRHLNLHCTQSIFSVLRHVQVLYILKFHFKCFPWTN